MIYVSLDIETGGLSTTCPVLEIAAIVEDTLKPKSFDESLKCRILVIDAADGQYIMEPKAAIMHAKSGLLDELHEARKRFANRAMHMEDGTIICEECDMLSHLAAFLDQARNLQGDPTQKITLAGKNVAMFDLPFLQSRHREYGNDDVILPIRHRVFDVGPRFFEIHDTEVPSTKECAKRANITASDSHRAIQDAWEVILMHRAAQ